LLLILIETDLSNERMEEALSFCKRLKMLNKVTKTSPKRMLCLKKKLLLKIEGMLKVNLKSKPENEDGVSEKGFCWKNQR
jgi:hypothetical protein